MASNGMMSQAEIEALMASMNAGQEGKKPEVQPAESAAREGQTVSADNAETQSEITGTDQDVNAVDGPMSKEEVAAFLESINAPKTEAISVSEADSSTEVIKSAESQAKEQGDAALSSDPNRTMTPEEIEAMLSKVNDAQEAKAEEPLKEIAAEAPAGDPSKTMTPEEIEAMLSKMNDAQEAKAEEPLKEIAAEAPAGDPSKTMTPEEIEAMLSKMNDAQEAKAEEPLKEIAAEAPAGDPSKTMTPEEIEAMLSKMNDAQEAKAEEPLKEIAAEAPAGDPSKTMTPEEIEAMLSKMNDAQEAKAEEPLKEIAAEAPVGDPSKTMTPEEIEAMLSKMNDAQEAKAEEPLKEIAAEAPASAPGNNLPSEEPEIVPPAASGKEADTEVAVSQKEQQQSEITLSETAQQKNEKVTKPSLFAALKEKFAGLTRKKVAGAAETGEAAAAKSLLLQGVSLKLGKNAASLRAAVIAACLLLALAAGMGIYYVGSFPQISFINRGNGVSLPGQNKLAKMGITFTPEEFVKYAGRGNKEVVELFLEGNMEVDAYRVSDGVTPLMAASSFGRVDILDLLIEKGANVNAKDKDDQTALMKAVKYNRIQVIEHLLKAKADIRGRDLYGNTVVSLALEKKDKQVMNMLSQAGVRGLEEGLAQIRSAVKTKGKNAEKLEGEQTPSISPEFMVVNGRAGYAQIGRPVETLYANYPEGNIISSTGNAGGRSYPLVKIMVPGQSSPSLLLSLSISKRGQQQLIDSIEVHDERFKTQEGISIKSTVGDIKRTTAGLGYVKQIGDVLYLVAKDNRTMFELEVGADTVPADWLKSGDVNSLPDDMKIRCILLM